jgi:SAM-dependent methyltransferase
LAALGAEVTAFDFSAALIDLARARTHPSGAITYQLLDATRPDQLRRLAKRVGPFDSLLCSMALFDISDIQPLFQAPPLLLRPGGAFVFSLGHPAFNHSSAARMVEQLDEGGQVRMLYSIKVSRYIPPYLAHGVALRGQSRPQVYFERPLQDYLILGFENGCVLDGFEERAFPPGHPQRDPLDWGGNFSEFPAVVVLRLRLKGS